MKNYTSKLIDLLLDEISPVEQAQTDAKMLLAAKIADAMAKKGWKAKDLLKAINKSSNPSIVTRWLSGTHNFTVETLVELEQALNINLLSIDTQTSQMTAKIEIRLTASVSAINHQCNWNNGFQVFRGQADGEMVQSQQVYHA